MSGVLSLTRVPVRLWSSYTKILERNPIRTKAATSVGAAFLGDYLAQRLSKPKHADSSNWRYDWGRTIRLCLFNGCMGCIGHFYYGALDRRVGLLAPTAPKTVFTKVVIDQLMFSPLCTLAFYAYKTIAEGRPGDYFRELEHKLWPTLKAGWSFWPLAHVINFAVVPNQHRILYINVVSVAGSFILSKAAAGDFSKKKMMKMKKEEKGGEQHVNIMEQGPPNEVLFDGVNVKVD